jgi:hypothetical protein
LAQNLLDFGVGVLQGIASSMSFGYVGGPSANDSDASIAGQITGTGIAGASGGLLQDAGTGAMGLGLVAEVPSAGTSTAVVAGGAAAAAAGTTLEAGAAANMANILAKSSAGKMQKEVERGQAPDSVKRVDKGRGPYEQDHVHFHDGSARNQDGTWKHGFSDLSNKVMNWLNGHGWN